MATFFGQRPRAIRWHISTGGSDRTKWRQDQVLGGGREQRAGLWVVEGEAKGEVWHAGSTTLIPSGMERLLDLGGTLPHSSTAAVPKLR